MEMQELAEQQAEEKYGKDFSELPANVQNQLYTEAMSDWHDNRMADAENASDAARDREMGI